MMANVMEKSRRSTGRGGHTESDNDYGDADDYQVDSRIRYGVELDGSQCRVVSILDGKIRDWNVYSGDTPAAALKTWMRSSRVGNAQVHIAWSGPRVELRQMRTGGEVTRQERKAVLAEMGEKEMAGVGVNAPLLAGVFYPPDGQSAGQPVALAGVPAAALDEIWELIGNRGWSIIPTVLLSQPDGIYLAIRSSCAVVYVVAGGHTIYHSELAAQGLDQLTSKLNEDRRGGDDSTTNAAQQAVLRGYLQSVIQETNRWLTNWTNSRQAKLPPQVWVHGPGGSLPQLIPGLIQSLGRGHDFPDVNQVQPSLGVGDTSIIPPTDMMQAFIACRAALATPGPLATLDNPRLLFEAAKSAERARTIKIAVVTITVLAVVVVALLAPVLLAIHTKDVALSKLQDSQQTATRLAPFYKTYQIAQAGQGALKAAQGSNPDTALVFSTINQTKPITAQFKSVSIAVKGTLVHVSLPVEDSSGQPFTDVAAWLLALKKAGALNAQIGALTYGQGTEIYSMSFDLPIRPSVSK